MGLSVSSGARPRVGGSGRVRVGATRLAAATPVPVLSLGRAIRSAGGVKRRFRIFCVEDPFSENDPGGEDGPGLELAISTFSLTHKQLALGMDEGRKRTMRRLLWYWQYSRNWRWQQVNAPFSIQQDLKAFHAFTECVCDSTSFEIATTNESSQWYWYWRRRLSSVKRPKARRVLRRARLLRDKLMGED